MQKPSSCCLACVNWRTRRELHGHVRAFATDRRVRIAALRIRRRARSHLRGAHQLKLLQGGVEYFAALIEDIDRSLREVRMETYIFAFDASGTAVAEALERAALRGVRVYLTMDGFGTPSIPREWVERFARSKVQWRIFLPLGRIGLLIPVRWRRLHRKLCAIDGAITYCGGINVVDDYFDPNYGPLKKPRLDFAVRVSGPLVQDAIEVMRRFWWGRTSAAELRAHGLQAARKSLGLSIREAASDASVDKAGERDFSEFANATSAPGAYADLVLRDNLRHRKAIERAYLKAIGSAREEVIIANAYFLPGARLRRALQHASRRGVRVRLLLQGRYEYFLQYHATRPLYGQLLESGVEIHEYFASFMHAKVAVVDRHWATVGSSNLDPLSLLLAREANVVMDDADFASDLHCRLETAMAQGARTVSAAEFAKRPWQQRILGALASMALRAGILVLGRRY
ncbi:MAG: cardiolipin synthase ClsB [Burkholderiaceae bacterium]